MPHSPAAKRASASSARPVYVKYPDLDQEESIAMKRIIRWVLNVKRASCPPSPLPRVANSWLCHRLMFSRSTQEGHAVA